MITTRSSLLCAILALKGMVMLAGMRHTAVLVLGSVLLAKAVSACGSSEPHMDIDTTAEAELNEKLLHINATVRAKLSEISTKIGQSLDANQFVSNPVAEMADRLARASDRLTPANG